MNPIIKQYQSDKEHLFKQSILSFYKVARATRSAAIRAFIRSGDIAAAITDELAEMEPLFLETFVASHVLGRFRSMKNGYDAMNRMRMQAAIDFTEQRLLLTPTQIEFLKSKYADTATEVTRGTTAAIESKAKQAADHIVNEGMTVKDGTVYLRDSLSNAGLNPKNIWLLETLVRAQIGVAYGAGRWNANQDPDIAEILWGYEYVTVGDDRVRPSHDAMEGASYPKDHPFWNENWVPNGFGCRCDILEIFKDETARMELKPAPATVEIDEETIAVGADEDWAYNPGMVYQDMLAAVG